MTTSRPAGAKKVRRDIVLDETDHEILRVLAADARTPNNVLAARVGLAASTCLMRVRRLQDAGVIRGFHADLAPEALGRPLQAIVSVRLQPNARPRIGSFAQRFAALPGVLNVFFLAGVNDFQIHLAARSADDLRDFVVKNLSASRDVASTETNLIFEHITGTALTGTSALGAGRHPAGGTPDGVDGLGDQVIERVVRGGAGVATCGGGPGQAVQDVAGEQAGDVLDRTGAVRLVPGPGVVAHAEDLQRRHLRVGGAEHALVHPVPQDAVHDGGVARPLLADVVGEVAVEVADQF